MKIHLPSIKTYHFWKRDCLCGGRHPDVLQDHRRKSAELTKKDEFYSIYWKEYNAVKNGMNSELKELPDYLEKRPVFEAKA